MKTSRLLIVEDEYIIAMNISQTLKRQGYEPLAIVSTGKEAISKAEEYHPDLILMDINLKGEMDGIEAADCIHKRLDIPIVFLTAFSDTKTLERAKETAPFGYILKPFEERELFIVVEMALHKHQLERELREARDELEIRVRERTKELIETNKKLESEVRERQRAEEVIKHRFEYEGVLFELSSRFVGTSDISHAIQLSLADILRACKADRAGIYRFRDNDTKIDNTHECCSMNVISTKEQQQDISLDNFPWWMNQLKEAEVIHIRDTNEMPGEAGLEQTFIKEQGIRSILAVPLYLKHNLAGFISLNNGKKTGEWSEDDLSLLIMSSEIIGTAIERQRSEELLCWYQEHYPAEQN